MNESRKTASVYLVVTLCSGRVWPGRVSCSVDSVKAAFPHKPAHAILSLNASPPLQMQVSSWVRWYAGEDQLSQAWHTVGLLGHISPSACV